jgi:hypothetical protein
MKSLTQNEGTLHFPSDRHEVEVLAKMSPVTELTFTQHPSMSVAK